MDLVKTIYQPWTKRAARRVVVGRPRDRRAADKGRFTRDDVDRLLKAAWRRYDEAAAKLAPQPTIGSRMNVRLACFTKVFLDEILADGVEREYAIELVSDAAWRIYSTWARLVAVVSRLRRGRTTLAWFKGGRRTGTASLKFPFNAPGYLIEPVLAERGTAFDVVRCPVADYFRTQGATDLCVAAWCNLDYALADLTHEKLVRTRTLVEGSDRCDFRVLPADQR